MALNLYQILAKQAEQKNVVSGALHRIASTKMGLLDHILEPMAAPCRFHSNLRAAFPVRYNY
jgi:hypothetical protein